MADFTLKKYEIFLKSLSENNIQVYGIYDFIKLKPEKAVILRHDVDRKPFNSLKIAKLENKYKIKSTYYFRIVKTSFNTDIIQKIKKLGHEIGYHYEDLSLAKGNLKKALQFFEDHFNKFKEYAEVHTISMHGRPLSSYDNRDLWKAVDFEKYGIKGEAFLSIDYSNIYYFTDTGRSWSENSVNLRDKVNSGLKADIKNTDELINFILSNKDVRTAIVTHPERWANSYFENLVNMLKDTVVNFIKRILNLIR